MVIFIIQKKNLLLVCLRNTERRLLKLNFLTSDLISLYCSFYIPSRESSAELFSSALIMDALIPQLHLQEESINASYLLVVCFSIFIQTNNMEREFYISFSGEHTKSQKHHLLLQKKVRNWGNNRKLFKMFRSIFYKNTMHWLLDFKHVFRMYSNILFIQDA